MSPLETAFEDGPAFIPYLVAGDPAPAATKQYVQALVSGGAAAVELGLPFSEPIAEGPTIQRGITRALDAGMTPEAYFSLVEELSVPVPLVCMTYYNLIHRYDGGGGPRAFVERAVSVGIDGLIVPDLPVEEAELLADACTTFDCDLVFIVAPTTTPPRLERIRRLGTGFVYVQARLGTTGARDDVSDAMRRSLAKIDDWTRPTAVGFGIATSDHARAAIEAGADGVVVGSALVDRVATGHESGTPPSEVADRLEQAAAELAAGAADGTLDPSVRAILQAARERPQPTERIDADSRSLVEAIEQTSRDGRVPIIAELKRTSPTAPDIRDDDAVELARAMVGGGATAVSVLTEPSHFEGSVDDLARVRSAIDVPVLRKDFVLKEPELDRVEADAVLLIARFVDDLEGLISATAERGMEALVEVHTEAELAAAVDAGAELIGVNNRDLASLDVDLGTSERLLPRVPDGVTRIAESGIATHTEVRRMIDAGADGLLIGSAIMQGEPTTVVESLAHPAKANQPGDGGSA